ncbi:hypothetical protein D3C76_670060 [compost metagenome]
MGLPGHGDLPFLHGFEQRRLDLGRRAVDLVGEDHVAEQRSGLEPDFVATFGLLENLGAGDVRRQQVGGELDAAHLRIQLPRQRLDRACLGQPGQAFQQQVTIGEQAEQHVANGLFLAENRLPDALFEGLDLFTHAHGLTPL